MNAVSLIPSSVNSSSVAFREAGVSDITYGALAQRSHDLPVDRGLVVLKTANAIDVVATYVSCFEAGVPVALVDSSVTDEFVAHLAETYRPAAIVGPGPEIAGYRTVVARGSALRWQVREDEPAPAHADLAVLLATSGSTGSPKFVKLSRTNVVSNADSIAHGLHIRAEHRAITSLPFSYSYGLSVINSHLVTGASVSLTESAVVTKDFWDLVRSDRVSTIAGVPTTYRMLRQMRWDPAGLPDLEYLTQAGGRLPDADRQHFLDAMQANGKDFYVMYGQTEATARITIAPPELLREHISTAGRAIPGGVLSIDGKPGDVDGPVTYRGPNVMMGYAGSADDLSTGDTMGGVLETGDLGYLADGALFITGRSKRIVKAFGVRVSLDDVDVWLQRGGNAVAVQGDDSIEIFVQTHELEPQELRRELASYLGLHVSGIRVTEIESIPLLSSGKIDLVALQELHKR